MEPDWIAVDWGTSNVRAWAMGPGERSEVLAEAGSDEGMGGLAPDAFEPALRRLIDPWTQGGPVPVLACGMVGARQGWVEAPYAPVPGPPLSPALARAPSATLDVRIVPGLSQADPPDVMRGEETKLAGLLLRDPGFDGAVLMPGTHPKWVRVSAGEVVAFRTSLTGEAFAALSGHTVLRHTVTAEGWDDAAFLAGVEEGMARPEMLLSRLFSLRAEALLRGLAPEAARARLSGLLIGLDLAGARGWWLGARVALVAAGEVGRSWRAALRAQGAAVEELDATALTLDGLRAARRLP